MAIVQTELGDFHGEPLPPDPPPPVPPRMIRSRGRRIVRVLTGFFLGQGAAQGVSILAGLLLVRTLSVEAYAQFGLATGFQAVFTTLMDMGFASTIIPMVADRRDDRALVGRYVRSAKHLRDRAFWMLAPVAILSFLAIMHKQHWSWTTQFMLLASVLLALYSSGRFSYYSAPLLIFGRLRAYYVPQVATGLGRLVAYIGLAFGGGLNAWTAAVLSALNVTLNASLLAKASQPYHEWPEQDDPVTDRELIHYILPAAPAIIFAAFQAQITLFLISIFGGTVYIAEVAALGRIGQLFAVLMTFNLIVVEPYIARLKRKQLLPIFLGFVALASLVGLPVVLIAFKWPGAFLWLLGAKYAGLGSIVGWVVLSACMNYIAGLIWIINRARKWVFWSGSMVEIVLLLGVQIAYVILIGVRTTREAVMLSLVSSFCYLTAHSYVSVRGFLLKPREIQGA